MSLLTSSPSVYFLWYEFNKPDVLVRLFLAEQQNYKACYACDPIRMYVTPHWLTGSIGPISGCVLGKIWEKSCFYFGCLFLLCVCL